MLYPKADDHEGVPGEDTTISTPWKKRWKEAAEAKQQEKNNLQWEILHAEGDAFKKGITNDPKDTGRRTDTNQWGKCTINIIYKRGDRTTCDNCKY